MTPSSSRTPGSARSARSLGVLCVLATAGILSCADGGTNPTELRFGQIGRLRIEVESPLGRDGIGGLQQILSWSSDGPWQRTERISYRGRPGDETVAVSRDDPGVLARSYASLISLVNDATPVQLFLDALSPALNPTCTERQSRVTVQIIDAQRDDSISWTRCAEGSLGSLTALPENADLAAGRVIQAAVLAREFTVGAKFAGAYSGSLPFATVDRGEQAKTPLLVPRVIEDAATWASFWALHTGASSAPPAVDFAKELVLVAAVGMRPEAGDSVEVRSVLPVAFGTQVTLWERRPGNFCTPAPRSHAPYHVVITPLVEELRRPIFFSVVDVDRIPCG